VEGLWANNLNSSLFCRYTVKPVESLIYFTSVLLNWLCLREKTRLSQVKTCLLYFVFFGYELRWTLDHIWCWDATLADYCIWNAMVTLEASRREVIGDVNFVACLAQIDSKFVSQITIIEWPRKDRAFSTIVSFW